MPPSQPSPFFDKLAARIASSGSLLCVGLDPNLDVLPGKYANSAISDADQLLNWNLDIIKSTADFACAFKPNIAFFEALGSNGHDLLVATLKAIPDDIPVILDAKRGDIGNTAAAYARACFEHLGVDAVTLNPYLGRDSIAPFLEYPDKGLFVLCRTSNPGSADFQELEISDWRTLDRELNQPLYVHVARTATAWAPQIGLVVGATFPESLEAVRQTAPEAWMLIPGIGSQGGEIRATLEAGLRSDGAGLIVNLSRGIAMADDPAAAAKRYRDELNAARDDLMARYGPASDSVRNGPLDELCLGLLNLGAVKFGDFTLASGIQSPIYIDLRLLASDPALLASVAEHYAAVLDNLPADRIAGVPYAALPIGTAVALGSGKPMIYPRKEVKSYGLQQGIEGLWNAGDEVVVIEDLVTSGGSTLSTVERLRAAGLMVNHAIVLIDREQGGVQNLAQHGVTVHGVFTMSAMLDSLLRQDAITQDQAENVRRFVKESSDR